MTLDALKSASRVMGTKQVSKAVKRGDATCVFLADDADARVQRRWQTSAMHVALRSAQQPRQSSDSLFVKNSGAKLQGFNK